MGFWETATKVGKGAAKFGAGMAKSFGERMEREMEQYRNYRDYASGRSDEALLKEVKLASGTRLRAIVDELKSRGYGEE